MHVQMDVRQDGATSPKIFPSAWVFGKVCHADRSSLRWLTGRHRRALWPSGAAISLSFPQHVPTVQRNQTADLRVPVPLRLLGYMDTLVHFGRFGLARLRKTEIDSWLVAN